VGKRENEYQAGLIKRIETRFPGCLVLKNDEQYIQGIPDLTILYRDRYAMLEVKRSEREVLDPEPNQDYYINLIWGMGSFSSFIFPENEEEVLDALQRSFQS
jgi:hypothetical protein